MAVQSHLKEEQLQAVTDRPSLYAQVEFDLYANHQNVNIGDSRGNVTATRFYRKSPRNLGSATESSDATMHDKEN